MAATPEMKAFAEAILALSKSAIGLMRATDQRTMTSRQVVEDLTKLMSQKDQTAARQCQVIRVLARKHTELDKELERTKQELRAAKGESPALSERSESGKGITLRTDVLDEKVNGEFKERIGSFNLPSMKDLLQRIETTHDDNQGKISQSPMSPPYSGSQQRFMSFSDLVLLPVDAQPVSPLTNVFIPSQNPLKRRRMDEANVPESESRCYLPRQKSPKSA